MRGVATTRTCVCCSHAVQTEPDRLSGQNFSWTFRRFCRGKGRTGSRKAVRNDGKCFERTTKHQKGGGKARSEVSELMGAHWVGAGLPPCLSPLTFTSSLSPRISPLWVFCKVISGLAEPPLFQRVDL